MRRIVARRAERSRSDFVCPGMSARDLCGGPWRAGPSVRGRTLFVRAISVSYGVLSSSGMGRFWRIFVSTSRKSGGKLRQTVQRTQRAE